MATVVDFTRAAFITQLKSTDKYRAIEELTGVFEGSGVCGSVPDLVRSLKEREEIMSTGIGFGIAIPHAKIESVSEMAFAIGISRGGIDFDSMDGRPVNLVILVAAGETQHKEYLRLLSNIMAILKKDAVKERIIHTDDPKEVMAILASEPAQQILD
jgi:mannitol/fructose-specific phosphotransferase system IIA component (Ntr-type)